MNKVLAKWWEPTDNEKFSAHFVHDIAKLAMDNPASVISDKIMMENYIQLVMVDQPDLQLIRLKKNHLIIFFPAQLF